jgi:hypothetical protein
VDRPVEQVVIVGKAPGFDSGFTSMVSM